MVVSYLRSKTYPSSPFESSCVGNLKNLYTDLVTLKHRVL